jgi:hypothetical protein
LSRPIDGNERVSIAGDEPGLLSVRRVLFLDLDGVISSSGFAGEKRSSTPFFGWEMATKVMVMGDDL